MLRILSPPLCHRVKNKVQTATSLCWVFSMKPFLSQIRRNRWLLNYFTPKKKKSKWLAKGFYRVTSKVYTLCSKKFTHSNSWFAFIHQETGSDRWQKVGALSGRRSKGDSVGKGLWEGEEGSWGYFLSHSIGLIPLLDLISGRRVSKHQETAGPPAYRGISGLWSRLT